MLPVLIFSALTISVLLMYAALLWRKIKLEKARRVAELTYRYRLTHAIISGVPPQYLSQDLTLFILRESIALLESLMQETPRDKRVRAALEQKTEQRYSVQNDYVKPQNMPLSSEQNARAVQGGLDALRTLVKVNSDRGHLDATLAKEFIRFINWQLIRCMTEVLMVKAQTSAEAKSYRIAIHTYNKALGLLERLPTHREAITAAESCKEKLAVVEEAQRLFLVQLEEETTQNQTKFGSSAIEEAWEKEFSEPLKSARAR